jgi:hypothetical protein
VQPTLACADRAKDFEPTTLPASAAIRANAWSLLILRNLQLPTWAGLPGALAASLVALPALKLFGISPPVSIALSATGIQLWGMALGLLFLWLALPESYCGCLAFPAACGRYRPGTTQASADGPRRGLRLRLAGSGPVVPRQPALYTCLCRS